MAYILVKHLKCDFILTLTLSQLLIMLRWLNNFYSSRILGYGPMCWRNTDPLYQIGLSVQGFPIFNELLSHPIKLPWKSDIIIVFWLYIFIVCAIQRCNLEELHIAKIPQY